MFEMLVKLMCMHCQSEIIKINARHEYTAQRHVLITLLITLGHSLSPGGSQMPISRLVHSKLRSIVK